MTPIKAISSLFGLATLLAAGGALLAVHQGWDVAGVLRPEAPPEPQVSRPAPPAAIPDPSQQTAAIAVRPEPPRNLGPVTGLRNGLAALGARQIELARLERDNLPANSIDAHILSWAIALYGGEAASAADILWVTENLPNWPGAAALRRNAERALYRDPAALAEVNIAEALPGDAVTMEGAMLKARAAEDKDAAHKKAAYGALAGIWRSQPLSPALEDVVLAEFGAALTPDDHRARMEMLLYKEQPKAAARVAELAKAKELATGWSAVLARVGNAQKLLGAVPESQRGAGYFFAQGRLHRNKNSNIEAASALIKSAEAKDSRPDADVWWQEARIVARRLIDAGKYEPAYRLAAAYPGEAAVDKADAAFHAGWIALRFLKKPDAAAQHFAKLTDAGAGAITSARGYYWQARAAEAAGSPDAAGLYAKAAHYGTTFYGQLAAAKAGGGRLDIEAPLPSDEDRRVFAGREAAQAIDRLELAGYPNYAARLYIDLAQQLASPGELALLADKAARRGDHYLALRVGKIGMQRGVDVGGLSHPVGAIPDAAEIDSAGKALAYAIARQESEFNVGAVSQAGAKGLLQLMPATAKQVAARVGLEFSEPRLTSDPAYNATLGAEELRLQLERFAGSYVLTFIAYNAGPKRADQWIKKLGDPRGKSVEEVVDWIERIPFSETRSYVQRVLENYEVYKMRLAGAADLERDLTEGRDMAMR